MEVNFEFLTIDEGKQNLLKADTESGKIHWTKSLADYPTARAMQRLNDDRVLMGYSRGYCIIEISTGKIIKDCARWRNVTSAYRNPAETTLITGLNLEDQMGVCVITLDQNDEVLTTQSCEGDYVRLMTVSENRYLLSTNDHIMICNNKLKTQSILRAEGFLHAWKSIVCPDGSILVSAGYGAFMAKFNEKGVLQSTFGRADELPPEVKPNFYASFCRINDGSILLANWQGHGVKNGSKGRQLIRFNSNGTYLNSWSFPDDISSMQGLLIL
jgi:hypothetical protein